MTDRPSALHVCIVNWRTADLTIDCLRSMVTERADVLLKVVVVDNDSGDGSDTRIRAAVEENAWGDWVQVVSAARNGGFAYGNNVAIRKALEGDPALRYVVLLNPDTLVRPGAFRVLLDFMHAHPTVGLAGGVSEDLDGTRQYCNFRFPSVINEFTSFLRLGAVDRWLRRWVILAGMPDRPEQVDWVSGAYLIIRREVIDQLGLLDEGYFLYFEETDFVLRARRAGWTCWHVPDSRIVHFVGKASGFNDAHVGARMQPDYWFESRRRYFTLNHGRWYAAMADMAAIAGIALCRLRRRLQGLQQLDPPGLERRYLRLGAVCKSTASLKPRMTQL